MLPGYELPCLAAARTFPYTRVNGYKDVIPLNPERKLAAANMPLVSILIPCCGMIEYTKLCVPSVLRHSRSPIELIFLDIGSLDGTVEYLAGIKAACQQHRVEIIRTPSDLGIGDA